MAAFDYLLPFGHRQSYTGNSAITIPIQLSFPGIAAAKINAKLDTGSTFCIFQRHFGETLGLDIEAGQLQWMTTATGRFCAYGHTLTLSVFDYEWETIVYFAEAENFRLNVVGRIGFLDHLRLALVDYEEVLYAGLYDET